MTDALDLIRTSIREDRIVVAEHSPELELDLMFESDDSADSGDTLELWGNHEGHDWRVHLRRAVAA